MVDWRLRPLPLDFLPDLVQHAVEAIVEPVPPGPGRRATAISCHDKRQTTGDWNDPLAMCDCAIHACNIISSDHYYTWNLDPNSTMDDSESID